MCLNCIFLSEIIKCIIPCFRKKDESQETDFKDAVAVCLPLIKAAIRDIEKGAFPKNCSLNIEIPTSPPSNKVCKFYHDLICFRPYVVPKPCEETFRLRSLLESELSFNVQLEHDICASCFWFKMSWLLFLVFILLELYYCKPTFHLFFLDSFFIS